MGIGASDGSFYPASFWSLLESPWTMVGPLVELESLLMHSMGAKDGSYFGFALFNMIKTLPKALRTQGLTTLTSCFVGFGLVGLVW